MSVLMMPSLLWGSDLSKNPQYVDIGKFEGVVIDLRYATPNNFMSENLYGDFRTAYLHQLAAEKFRQAIKNLHKEKPKWKFVVFDSLRPHSVQKKMWSKVKDTPHQEYVADPAKGSVHNFGFALDLSLLDENGKEVDMGTPFDSFDELSQPKLEEGFLKQGKLTPQQIANRKILRQVMTAAGFLQLPHEWWHFDALPGDEVRKTFKLVQ